MSEDSEVGTAVMRGQEVEESFVVLVRHAEQLQQLTIVDTGRREALAHEFPHVMSRNVARQEQRVDMVPERIAAVHQRRVQLVGDLHPSLTCRTNRLRRDSKNLRQLRD